MVQGLGVSDSLERGWHWLGVEGHTASCIPGGDYRPEGVQWPQKP